VWYESLPEKKCLFPVNKDNIPDIIVYYQDSEEACRRKCFARIKAKDVYNEDMCEPIFVKFQEERSLDLVSDDDFPGFVYLRICL
jgi:hypothetical protein